MFCSARRRQRLSASDVAQLQQAGEVGDVVVDVRDGGHDVGLAGQLGALLGLARGHHLEVEEALAHLAQHPGDLVGRADARPGRSATARPARPVVRTGAAAGPVASRSTNQSGSTLLSTTAPEGQLRGRRAPR